MKTDHELYNDIRIKLEADPEINSHKIAISVHGGVVTLGGVVGKYTEKLAAERAVKNVRWVKGIANEIKIESFPDYKRDDFDIVQAAVHALLWNASVPQESITVVVENGWITLSGEVAHFYQKQAAEYEVSNIYGIHGVRNKILIKPIATPVAIKEKIIKEFERNAVLDAQRIEVETMGGTAVLKGRVRNWLEIQEALNAAWSVPGVSKVDCQLALSW